jgi:histone deacetylase complex regulatory component SIN3
MEGTAPSRGSINAAIAITYLNAIKAQIGQPDVYNQFIDTMKEYQNQQTDIPNIIKRVSNLFRAHPSLIEQFNTFLPAGYRIVIEPSYGVGSMGGSGIGQIMVMIPQGTMRGINNGASLVWR